MAGKQIMHLQKNVLTSTDQLLFLLAFIWVKLQELTLNIGPQQFYLLFSGPAAFVFAVFGIKIKVEKG